jgi:hypothetical protein
MDTELESASGTTTANATFPDKCNTINSLFNTMGLHRCELIVPAVGLCTSPMYPIAHVKYQDIEGEVILKHMKFVMCIDPKLGLRRYVEQQLTRPMHLNRGQTPGFSYEVSPKKDVKISRLIVDLKDLEHAIDELIAEANRFYLLFCYPYN